MKMFSLYELAQVLEISTGDLIRELTKKQILISDNSELRPTLLGIAEFGIELERNTTIPRILVPWPNLPLQLLLSNY